MKTSIKIKKFWHSDIASDGGAGLLWKEIAPAQREATVQFNGSDADISNYKNVLGNTLESAIVKGDKTLNFQFADLTPEEIAEFVGGSVTSDSDSEGYEAPENENQSIEKSLMFLTDKNVLFIIPRASVDAYPIVNDDDLHYYQVNTTVLKPTKSGIGSYKYNVLTAAGAAKTDITSFDILDENGDTVLTGAATINTVAHTVTAEVENGTGLVALAPVIGVDLGAGITPNSGVTKDFTAAVEYTVEAADGTTQVWTITVTEAA